MAFPMGKGIKKGMKAPEKPSCEISYSLEETQNLTQTRGEEEGNCQGSPCNELEV